MMKSWEVFYIHTEHTVMQNKHCRVDETWYPYFKNVEDNDQISDFWSSKILNVSTEMSL